ncbi:MAG: DinB family protein [Bacteroidota bacterium]
MKTASIEVINQTATINDPTTMNNWTAQLDQTTQLFQKYFGQLTPTELNWKPDAKTWSIAQNIDHLMVLNSTYFPLLDDLKAGKNKLPFLARFNFAVNFFGKLILKSVQPEEKKKINTFPIWEPTKSEIAGDILDRFTTHQSQLKRAIMNTEDLAAKGVVITSPANKNIVYKLSTAFEVIVAHELRHLKKARSVLALLKK